MKKVPVFLFLTLFYLTGYSQSISFSTGIAPEINNSAVTKSFIPVEINWHPFKNNPLSLIVDYDFGLPIHNNAKAFTLNHSLPQEITLKENPHTNIFTVGLNLDFNISRFHNGNQLLLSVMPLAGSFQKTKVSYENYDKNNYSILNQKINSSFKGLVMAYGVRYLFDRNKIVALDIQTPLLRTRPKFFYSKFPAPLRLLFGYQLNYDKKK